MRRPRCRLWCCALLLTASCAGCGLDSQESPEPVPAGQLPTPVDGVLPASSGNPTVSDGP